MSRMRYRAIVVTLLAAAATFATETPAAQAMPAGDALSQTVVPTVASCSVSFSQWGSGYTASVTVTGPAFGWSIPFVIPVGHQVTQAWNAMVSVSGQNGTASNSYWSGNLGAGQTTIFGLNFIRPAGDTRLATFPTCTVVT